MDVISIEKSKDRYIFKRENNSNYIQIQVYRYRLLAKSLLKNERVSQKELCRKYSK